MYCQSRLCLEGKQLRGRQAQNCNVILAAIFTGEKGGGWGGGEGGGGQKSTEEGLSRSDIAESTPSRIMILS